MEKLRIFSGAQPTGELHIGNYLGAIKNWAALQDDYDCFYCVVDYHALTFASERGADFNPAQLKKDTLNLAMDLIACGIDPKKSIVFVQSHIPEHTELAWVFNCFTSYGDLLRMTQFKDKSDKADFISAGLFDYPVLQAADILLYKAERVPVGEDQVQHLELCRRIARRFNSQLGKELFPEVEPILTQGSRIMSLAEPEQKMSKSLGPKHYIGLMEPEKSILNKVKSAVTDVGLKPGQEMAPGVENLLKIIKITAGDAVFESLKAEHAAGKLMYSKLKDTVYEFLMKELEPVRKRRQELKEDDVREVLKDGAERARAVAVKTIAEVRTLLGVGAK
jgi:tryptophanyl-tRNA synthetase